MPDRFDFLEFGDDKPAATAPPPPPVGTIEPEQSWKPLKLRAIEVIGDPGTGAGQFSLPTGIAVDQFGSLYVADSNNHRIQRITTSGDVYCIGKPGTAVGEMWQPQSVAVSPNGEFFFVAEAGTNRVQCFRFTGQSKGTVTGFKNPMGVAFDPEGRLWIADTGNGRLLRMNVQNGQYVGGFDHKAGFQRPISIAVDRFRQIYVTCTTGQNVIKFDTQGRKLSSLADRRKLAFPTSCAVDAMGRVYVVESEANRLHVFDHEGNSLIAFDRLSSKMGSLKAPSSVALGPQGEIYISDTQNHRIVRLGWE